jgi:hypothetical protein
MENYIVRIYRRDTQTISGVVEGVERGTRIGFADANELLEILRRGPAPSESVKPSDTTLPGRRRRR